MNDQSNIRNSGEILKLRAFEPKFYDRYSLTSLTAYCLYWLHEWGITTNKENLAVISFKLFPIKFSMVGWPGYPDMDRTNRSVLQMRPKYRNLATSVSEQGVFLNDNGIQEAKALIAKLGAPFFEGEVPASNQRNFVLSERGKGKARSVHAQDILKKLYKSHLFHLYNDSRFAEAVTIDLIEMLDVYDHTPEREKKIKFKQFMDAAKEMKDEKATAFLSEVAERFTKYLNK